MMNTSLPNGARYTRALEVIRESRTPLTKNEIEQAARICPFNSQRWWRFQMLFQDEIIVHPVNNKVYHIKK